MMTMHSAKGLEFPCVYVVGVEEGIFPGERVRVEYELPSSKLVSPKPDAPCA